MEPTTNRVTDATRLDDQGLIRRARDGDADAFDAIAGNRIPDAYRLASAILGSQAAAADATQNALLAAWRELPHLRDLERFDAWFHRILVNECRMQVRQQSRRREVEHRRDRSGVPRLRTREAPTPRRCSWSRCSTCSRGRSSASSPTTGR